MACLDSWNSRMRKSSILEDFGVWRYSSIQMELVLWELCCLANNDKSSIKLLLGLLNCAACYYYYYYYWWNQGSIFVFHALTLHTQTKICKEGVYCSHLGPCGCRNPAERFKLSLATWNRRCFPFETHKTLDWWMGHFCRLAACIKMFCLLNFVLMCYKYFCAMHLKVSNPLN